MPDDDSDPASPGAETESTARPWWKRKRWNIPLGILAVFVLAGIFGDPPEEADEETTAAEVEDDEDEEEEEPEEEPEGDPEPEEEPEPEPESMPDETEVLPEDEQRAIFAMAFNERRDSHAEALEGTIDVETVDLITFDEDAGTVEVGVTSTWASDGNIREGAWGTVRELAFLWSDNFWDLDGERDPVWWPDLSLGVSQFSYECSGETMRDLAERRIDRNSWEAAC